MSGENQFNDTRLLEHDDTEGLVRQVSAQAVASVATFPLRRLRTSHKLTSVGTLLVVALVVLLAKIAMSTTGPALANPTNVVSRVEDTKTEKDEKPDTKTAKDEKSDTKDEKDEKSNTDEKEEKSATEPKKAVKKDISILDSKDVPTLLKLAEAAMKHVKKKRASGDDTLVQKTCKAPQPTIIEKKQEQQGKPFCCFSGNGAKGTKEFCNSCFPGAKAAPGSFCSQNIQNCMSGGGDATWCGTEPPKTTKPPEKTLQVLPPTDHCSTIEENCMKTKCCKVSGKTCFTKNKFFAGCLDKCVKGVTEGWDCDPLINDAAVPESPRGYVSLYCWAVMRASGYEPSLVRTQLVKGAGIFGCDAWTVLSKGSTWLRKGDPSNINSTALPETTHDSDSKLGGGSDATTSWVNANLFLLAWKTIGDMKKYQKHDWIVKVDPDAVFLPSRLRDQLKIFGAVGKLYFTNCKGVRHGLYGSIEVISNQAVKTYIDGMTKCSEKLPYKKWGEDRFTESCMDLLEIGHVENFCLANDGCCGQILDHGVCKHSSRCVTGEAAFHPFKNVLVWFKCLEEAQGS